MAHGTGRVLWPPDEFRLRVAERLARAGHDARDAAVIADHLLEAELAGRPTHGLLRLSTMLKFRPARAAADARPAREGPWFAQFDGRGLPSIAIADRAARAAIEKGLSHGIGLGAVFGVSGGTTGMLSTYARRAAEAGLVSIVACNCGPIVAPHGASGRALGTNPIAFGFPAGERPLIVDFSTSALTFGELFARKARGETLEPGTAFDAEGRPTRDPSAALEGAFAAWGGAKGSALSLAIQLLAGAFVGAGQTGGATSGFLSLAARPETFTTREAFEAEVREVMERVRAARPVEGGPPVRLPGDRAEEARRRILDRGIEVDEELLAG